jgi:hypothetical protein
MVQKTVNSFNEGMDRDTSFTKYDPNNYYDAENLRIVIDEGGKSGTLNNIKGDTLDFILTDGEDYEITSHCISHDYLVIFAVNTRDELTSIFCSPVSSIISNVGTYSIPKVYTFPYMYYIYNCLGRYEKVDDISDKLKVYFIEDTNGLCMIDVLNLPTYAPVNIDYLKIVPEFKGSPIEDITETSGSIKTGSVQYSYQLYNTIGQESMFTPASKVLTVTASQSSEEIKNYNGNPSNVISSKGFNFNVTIESAPFNRIRVVRLFYQTLNTLPEVIIIYEGSVVEGDIINITDSGQTLGSYTPEEFRFIANIIYPKYIEEKNNYLFAANYSETTFDIDFDARAYRYRTSDDSTYVTNPAIEPETSDVINPYNNLDNDGDATKTYIYQSDGVTLGGEGINVSYEFTTDTCLLDDQSNDTLVTGASTTSQCNPLTNVGYQRDEIYRFGIVFFDYYGRSSFVKWIDDIRFPNCNDTGYDIVSPTTAIGDSIIGIILGIKFKIDTTTLPDSIYGYQIVRCKRDEANRTVIDCGICGHTEHYTTSERGFRGGYVVDLVPQPYPRLMSIADYDSITAGDIGKNILEYITPEFNYNNKRVLQANKLYTYKRVSVINKTIASNVMLPSGILVNVRKILCYSFDFENILNIKETKSFLLNQTSTVYDSIDSVNIRHQNRVDYDHESPPGVHDYQEWGGTKGSTLIIALESNFNPTSSIGPAYCYRRNNISPYGGANYGARQNSYYYPCGEFITRDNFSVNYEDAYNGDVYITMFEYNRGILTKLDIGDHKGSELLHFPVESTINTNVKSNPTFNSLHDGSLLYAARPTFVYMQEEAGTWETEVSNVFYVQDYNLYTYNSVYSQQDISKEYLVKPLDFNLTSIYENTVTSSEKKTDGELTDSWTKFKFNNNLTLNGKFGPVSGLINFKNILIATQPDGYCILSVEDREIQPSSNIGGYVLGTGGVLSRFDYINTDIGVKESISLGKVNLLATANALYMYDSERKKIFRYTGEHEVLSDKHGLISLVAGLTSTYPNFTMGYSRKYGEVYLSNTALNKTLVFSELTNNFMGNYIINTPMWINYKNYTWALNDVNTAGQGRSFYLQDSGTAYNTFLGVYSPSTLTIIVNPQGVIPVRFDNIQFNTECGPTSTEDGYGITSIQFDNSYQTSGVISLLKESLNEMTANFRRRFRSWRFNTIFDTAENRFKDAYLKCKISFTDPVGAHTTSIQISDIITGYTQLPIK